MTKYLLIEKSTGKNIRIVDDEKQLDERSDWRRTYIEEQGYSPDEICILSESDIEIDLSGYDFDLYETKLDGTVEFKGEVGYQYYFGTQYQSALITSFDRKDIYITSKRLLSENEIEQLENDLGKKYIEFKEFKQQHIKYDIE